MAVLETRVETPLDLIRRGIEALPAWLARQHDENLGPVAIELREIVDRSEGLSAEVVRRFEKSGAWAADGALNMVAWLKGNGRLSGGAAMERVAMGRQLEKLPDTAQAFQRGDLGNQHVAILSRTAEKVGTGAFKKEKPACCRRRRAWTRASLRAWQRPLSSGWTRPPRWLKPTRHIARATCA